ncbi:MAG: PilZ domain-containing protein [Nitrospirota bacterium]
MKKRKESRRTESHKVIYHMERKPDERRQFGMTLNVSSSGFCMYSMQECEPGDRLQATIEGTEHASRAAAVRWSEEALAGRLYRVGLQWDGE